MDNNGRGFNLVVSLPGDEMFEIGESRVLLGDFVKFKVQRGLEVFCVKGWVKTICRAGNYVYVDMEEGWLSRKAPPGMEAIYKVKIADVISKCDYYK